VLCTACLSVPLRTCMHACMHAHVHVQTHMHVRELTTVINCLSARPTGTTLQGLGGVQRCNSFRCIVQCTSYKVDRM